MHSTVWRDAAVMMGVLPMLVMFSLRLAGAERDVAYWWLARAYFVSVVADMLAFVLDPYVVSLCYPIVQSCIIGSVLLKQKEGHQFVYASVLIGLFAIFFLVYFQPTYDVLLRSVSWGVIAVLAWTREPRDTVAGALFVSFGVGLAAWYVFNAAPSFQSWAEYQGVRAIGILLFCAACLSRRPSLRLAAQ